MKIRLLTVIVALSCGCQTGVQPDRQVANPTVSENASQTPDAARTFTNGIIDRFVFSEWAGSDIPVWLYLPTGVDLRNAPILVMLHGAKRNSERYLREWQPIAQQHGIIVIAPEYSKADFPKSNEYNLGGVFNKNDNAVRSETLWSFSVIEPLFDFVIDELGSNETEYTMFGHSAGSQFVHRYLYYKPNARVKCYLIANAGWYTLPDLGEQYPYGLKGGEISAPTLEAALGKEVVILIGDQDNDPDHGSLRRTPEAMRQGQHRFARGLNFFEVGKQQAQHRNVPFNWKVKIVGGVAHSNAGMARGAVSFLGHSGTERCSSNN